MSPTEPSPGRSTPSYSCWATAMVRLEEKPSLREASCCRVEVMNGGAARRLRSLLCAARGVAAAPALALVHLGTRPGGAPGRLGGGGCRALVAEDELLLLADRV